MAVNLATKYSDKIASYFSIKSVVHGNTNNDYKFTGAKTIQIYTPITQPLSDYNRTGIHRYGTPSEMQDTIQELSLSKDRSFSITIDRGNNSEQMSVKEAGKMLALELEEQVIPEMDKYALVKFIDNAGKIKELSGPITTEYTTKGKLLGHISIIQTDIVEAAKKHQINEDKALLLQHMVLAHHGKYEYGSPVLPHTLEAEVLYLIDNMDSRIHMIIKALNNVEKNSFTNKIPALEGRSFYKYDE